MKRKNNLISPGKIVTLLLHMNRGGSSRAVKRGLLFIDHNNSKANPFLISACGVRDAFHEACAGIGFFYFNAQIVEVVMTRLTKKEQHKIAIHLVIVALLNEAEPQWDAMPGEVRREWRRAWDKTLSRY